MVTTLRRRDTTTLLVCSNTTAVLILIVGDAMPCHHTGYNRHVLRYKKRKSKENKRKTEKKTNRKRKNILEYIRRKKNVVPPCRGCGRHLKKKKHDYFCTEQDQEPRNKGK